MLVWLIKDGEILPTQEGGRNMRTGMLAEALLARGHRVVWWASTFSHQEKRLRHDRNTVVPVREGYELRLLHAGSYGRNFSFARYRHHKALSRKFGTAAAEAERPDAIVCAFPTIDLAHACARYARVNSVPFVVDIRDLWPDTFLEYLPAPVRPLGRLFLRKDFRMTRDALATATGLVAISDGVLAWALGYAGRPRRNVDRVFYTSYPASPETAKPKTPTSPFVRDLERTVGNKAIFAFVGTFGKSYELKTVVAAARRLKERGIDGVRVVLAGTGENFGEISSLAKDLDNVTLTGWLSHADVSVLLRRSRAGLVCCRSVEDALPNKFFEYLSAGLPVLSSLTGEAERIIADNGVGYSYPCDDAERLSGLIADMVSNPARLDAMSRSARALFDGKFHPSAIYPEYARYVETIAHAEHC